jgi:hypothetical protein
MERLSIMSTRIKFLLGGAMALVAVAAAAQQLNLPSGPAGVGELVFESGQKTLAVGVSVADEDVGKPGAIYVQVVSSNGDKRYLSPNGLADSPSAVFSGQLPPEWQRSVDLEPLLRSAVSKRAKDDLMPSDLCAAAFPNTDMASFTIEVGYSVGRSMSDNGDAAFAAVISALDRTIAKARQQGRDEVVRRLMASRERYMAGLGNMKAARAANAATDPKDAESFQSWPVVDFSCN